MKKIIIALFLTAGGIVQAFSEPLCEAMPGYIYDSKAGKCVPLSGVVTTTSGSGKADQKVLQ